MLLPCEWIRRNTVEPPISGWVFSNLEQSEGEQKGAVPRPEIELSERKYHTDLANVVRILAQNSKFPHQILTIINYKCLFIIL